MTEIITPIPARLKNVAKGGHVAGADDIFDDARNQSLSQTLEEKADKSNYYTKEEIDAMLGNDLQSITWSGGSISPSTVTVGETATLIKGTVTAFYRSGRTDNVTNGATFLAQRGTINGTTYTAPNSSGVDVISVTYNGKTAASTITATIEDAAPFLHVFVGSGISSASAVFSDTGNALSSNMIVTITNQAGDYLFVKIDKRQTLNNLFTYPGPNMEEFEYAIALDSPVESGDYKIYKSTSRYNADTAQYKLNRI